MRLHLEYGNPGWLVARTKAPLTPDAQALSAVDDAGQCWGMVAFDMWTPASCFMHIALASPLAGRLFLSGKAPAFDLPFNHAGKSVLFGLTRADNAKAVRLNRHLGFREAHRLKDGWAPGVDFILFEMRKEECRWLRAHRRAA